MGSRRSRRRGKRKRRNINSRSRSIMRRSSVRRGRSR
jgi:hypothetical protein